jgi:DNA polymerase
MPATQNVCAVDFETTYSNEVNVKAMGNRRYAAETDAYLVSLCGDEGFKYTGPPESAPWDRINGWHWVSHNVGFDSAIYFALQWRGVASLVEPASWHCTADMCSFLGLGRKLPVAVKNAFGLEISKDVRTYLKGKFFSELKPERRQKVLEYNANDAYYCYELWRKYEARWPLLERAFANVTRARGYQGITVNTGLLDTYYTRLLELSEETRAKIPWSHMRPPLAMAAVREFCQSVNIPAPDSLAEDSESALAWEAQYGEQYPLVRSLRDYRKANMYLRKAEAIRNRICGDGRMSFSLKYFGAGATGRMSGGDGLNMQNFPREAYQGMDLRHLFVATPGYKLVIADFAQIEPRIVTWLSGNKALLEALRAGHNLYEADARIAGIYQGPDGLFKKLNPGLYQTQKAQTLGIGYGLGIEKFVRVAKLQMDMDIKPASAAAIIAHWHARNPGVKRFWRNLEADFRKALFRHEDYWIDLPSGRRLTYYHPHWHEGRMVATTEQGSPRIRPYWGAHLFENAVQAIARDVLRDTILALETVAGAPVIFSSHDEVVCEVPEEYDSHQILSIMRISPEWALGLPLNAEAVESKHYLKA